MSAIISSCGQYRYKLTRPGDLTATRGPAVFIMINPSYADAERDDRTIGRCRSFARDWGCDGIIVGNMYGLISSDPDVLWTHPDPVGPENDAHLVEIIRGAGEIVCAWGADARADRVAAVVAVLAAAGARLRCLGITKSGAPRHPLYIAASQKLIDWAPAQNAKRRTAP